MTEVAGLEGPSFDATRADLSINFLVSYLAGLTSKMYVWRRVGSRQLHTSYVLLDLTVSFGVLKIRWWWMTQFVWVEDSI